MIATLITTDKAEFFFYFVKVSIKCSLINRWQLSKLLTKQVTEIHTNLPNRATALLDNLNEVTQQCCS